MNRLFRYRFAQSEGRSPSEYRFSPLALPLALPLASLELAKGLSLWSRGLRPRVRPRSPLGSAKPVSSVDGAEPPSSLNRPYGAVIKTT